MEIYEILKKLNGEIEPVGESNIDSERFENLLRTIELTETLIDEIIYVARHKDRVEYSISKLGIEADKFITELKSKIL